MANPCSFETCNATTSAINDKSFRGRVKRGHWVGVDGGTMGGDPGAPGYVFGLLRGTGRRAECLIRAPSASAASTSEPQAPARGPHLPVAPAAGHPRLMGRLPMFCERNAMLCPVAGAPGSDGSAATHAGARTMLPGARIHGRRRGAGRHEPSRDRQEADEHSRRCALPTATGEQPFRLQLRRGLLKRAEGTARPTVSKACPRKRGHGTRAVSQRTPLKSGGGRAAGGRVIV